MIVADTDVLSAMAKVARLSLLFDLLRVDKLHITPGVVAELEYSLNMGRAYARDVFALLVAGRIEVVYLTADEATSRDALPVSLGRGERESIAVAKERGGAILSNESRVAHLCRQYGIGCLRIPDILRALWVEGVIVDDEVRGIVADLRLKDRMEFKQSVLDAIFCD